VRLSALAAAGVPLGCGGSGPDAASPAATPGDALVSGRLGTRWHAPTTTLTPGEHALGIDAPRDGYIRLPASYQPGVPAPLVLLLHGGSHDAHEWSGGFPLFDALGLIALAVDSRTRTWVIENGLDAAFIDRALAQAFDSCSVDQSRMAIAGFSDGASYALSLGLANGDLFTHVLGFSPGYLAGTERHGQPPVFLSHGRQDPILPITFTRALADQLRQQGYRVTYQEFEGGHELPDAIGQQGFGWFVAG